LIDILLAYAIPAALITMLPGPDTAVVLATAIKAGRGAAARAAWGVGTGLLLWGAAVAFGLASALRSSAVLYDVFRLSCAAYLVVLGVQALRASRAYRLAGQAPASPPRGRWISRLPSFGWGYRRALMTCVLNPKLGVFFVVLLPQFIPSGEPVGRTSLALAALQAAEAVLWYLLLGQLAGGATSVLARQQTRVWMDRITGTVFIGFGLRLAAEARA